MSVKISITTAFTAAVLFASQVQAASCLTGGCHEQMVSKKYLHGPIAAEQADVMGCKACHIPAGKECSIDQAGTFKPLAPSITMCQTCHAKGNDTLHSAEELDCLQCHDPHGSDTSPVFERNRK